jgi:hypothetical protein
MKHSSAGSAADGTMTFVGTAAGVGELVYPEVSKTSARKGVRVRVPPPAPFLDNVPPVPVP